MYKDEILDHVKKLWINWRGDLHRHFVKPNKTMQEAMKKVPKDIPKDDWEWLVKEHFSAGSFWYVLMLPLNFQPFVQLTI